MTITDVETKTIAPQRVLALHQSLAEDDDADQPDVEELFERVIPLMDSAGADRASPISWREVDPHNVSVHAGFVAPTANVRGLDVVVLPGITAASVIRRGDVADMNEAHQAIARWAEANDHAASVEKGRWRELYLETNDEDHSDWLIEVQLELSVI